MKKQIKLTESDILKAVKEAVSEFISDNTIDEPRYFGYDYEKHINNPSQKQKDADYEWSAEHAFDNLRNIGNPEWEYQPSTSSDRFYLNTPDLHSYPDTNTNLTDMYGFYGMKAQGDENDSSTEWARCQRSTPRQTSQAYRNIIDQEETNEENADNSVLDKILSETIHREIKNFFYKKYDF